LTDLPELSAAKVELKTMNRSILTVLIVITILGLAACGRRSEAAATDDSDAISSTSEESSSTSTNAESASALDNSYEGALPPTNQLILGILRLEETDDAVTSPQAATMLPLWQALQSGSIQNQSERAAILRQIEGALTDVQFEAIGAMQLTFTDMNDWAQANGVELPQFGQGGQQGQGGQRGQGGQGGQGGIFADMSAEERAAFRQEMQDLSPEERAERLREMGVEVPEGGFQGRGQGGPGGGGRFGALIAPLIELLQAKATL
jgi:hypothetical protein